MRFSLLAYAAASLLHFAHNAEFLSDYPNLPDTWTRAGVYGAWLGITFIGATGVWLTLRGRSLAGRLFLAVYAAFGLDSLAHYAVAPVSAHSLGMNLTIWLETATASALLFSLFVHWRFRWR